MKIPISPGLYLVYVGLLYLVVGLVNIFVYRFAPSELLSLAYVVILALPLLIPRLARWVGVTVIWRLI